ncbi:MAG: copper resistance system multicopper oxidase [Deferrisomatales bacterium]
MFSDHPITRRHLLQGAAAAGGLTGLEALLPGWARAQSVQGAALGAGGAVDLAIGETAFRVAGRDATAVTVNGTVPGPLIRLRQGQEALLRVANRLGEDTSIHWHGILLPAPMDGVPGVSFPGIRPGETFTYRFPVVQSGTYWYHSHSGLQEQLGHFGPLLIDPAEPEPYRYDREYVVMLSDWTFENPYRVLAKLKKQSGYYNFQRLTVADLVREARSSSWGAALAERRAWAAMRMDPTDLADVTGYTYTFLVNGVAPADNWTGLFRPGERVRLRFINAAAMTYFDLRIPGLPMTVVQADGQDVEPVTVDELRIAVAETYDVIVEPREDRAYTVFAEAMDRSGFARGTLAPRQGLSAPLPAPRKRPLRTMADMGMAGHGGAMAHGAGASAATDPAHDHGPASDMVAQAPRGRLGEPGTGLEDAEHRVLVYADLWSLAPGDDARPPGREVELHLTGNMERYVWGFDGKTLSEAEPIPFILGERLRLTLVNDTMMDHPIHLHGMWMELDNGAGPWKPKKHTVNVKPGERLSVEITADAPGDWAFHCHLIYHMKLGMFRVVSVAPAGEVRS